MGSRSSAIDTHSLPPQRPIRRFDIFAEYNRLRGLDKGLDDAHAKGYGLWLAKVVASGGGRRARSQHEETTSPQQGGERQEESRQTPREQEWHELDGEPQTGALFDREIIQRMGPDFYTRVFAPAIAEAVSQGRSYEGIRDTLRKGWTPTRP